VLPDPGIARINRATCSGSSSWTKCRAPGIRNSSEPGRNSWNVRATPLFREGSASPKMIRTGRLNSFSLGIICVRMFERLGRRAGMPFTIFPHMLRHACGYALANAGHDMRALQAWLGHKNIQHTVRYTELAPDRFKNFSRD
jgi:integrase